MANQADNLSALPAGVFYLQDIFLVTMEKLIVMESWDMGAGLQSCSSNVPSSQYDFSHLRMEDFDGLIDYQ